MNTEHIGRVHRVVDPNRFPRRRAKPPTMPKTEPEVTACSTDELIKRLDRLEKKLAKGAGEETADDDASAEAPAEATAVAGGEVVVEPAAEAAEPPVEVDAAVAEAVDAAVEPKAVEFVVEAAPLAEPVGEAVDATELAEAAAEPAAEAAPLAEDATELADAAAEPAEPAPVGNPVAEVVDPEPAALEEVAVDEVIEAVEAAPVGGAVDAEAVEVADADIKELKAEAKAEAEDDGEPKDDEVVEADENKDDDQVEGPMMKMLLLRIAKVEEQLAASSHPKLALNIASAAVAAADRIAVAAGTMNARAETTAIDAAALTEKLEKSMELAVQQGVERHAEQIGVQLNSVFEDRVQAAREVAQGLSSMRGELASVAKSLARDEAPEDLKTPSGLARHSILTDFK